MRAVMIDAFDDLSKVRVANIPIPRPGPNEVLIKVNLAPVNFVDTLIFKGSYQFLPALPFTPGKGPVGTVLATGANVREVREGDRVIAMAEQGGYAEYALSAASDVYRIPDSLSFETAAVFSLTYDTAWFALFERGRLQKGETVLVIGGTGSVGNAAIKLAKAKGAYVISTVSTRSDAAAVSAAGADGIVDLSCPGIRDSLREQVYVLTGQRGVDLVVDMVGGDAFSAALRAVAWRGRVVIVGFASGIIPTLKTNYLLLKNIEISGLQISDYRKRCPELMKKCFGDVFKLAKDKKILPENYIVISLEEFAQALNLVAKRGGSERILLSPSASNCS